MTVTLHLTGRQTETLAAEITAFFTEALGTVPQRQPPAPPAPTDLRGDPLAIAALMLAVPGAITATLDLAARARLAERLDRLLARLRHTAGPDDSISLTTGSAPPINLITADRDTVLDRLDQPPPTGTSPTDHDPAS